LLFRDLGGANIFSVVLLAEGGGLATPCPSTEVASSTASADVAPLSTVVKSKKERRLGMSNINI